MAVSSPREISPNGTTRAIDAPNRAEEIRALIEGIPELVIVHRDGRVVYVNPAAVAALGHARPEDLVGKRLADLIHTEDHAALGARIETMTRSGKPSPSSELRLLRKDGQSLTVEIVGVPLMFEGEPAIVSTARDITERKQMQAQLLQTDRLVALGTLAAGVAHEVNNPLTYVLANLDLVARSLRVRAEDCRSSGVVNGSEIATRLDDLAVALGAAQQGADRVRSIVRDLTTFARTGTQHRSLLDVRSVLKPVISLVWNEIRHRARFVRDFQSVPLIDANEARLGQVFVNLLLNAVQAIPEGRADENEIVVATRTDDLGRAIVEIRDTGSGIPEDVVSHIFEPFFTTKPVGRGTGLGLSICHGAIVALGGEITVRSSPGAGSVFQVAIPPPARTGPARRVPVPPFAGQRSRVLIVEDEPLLTDSLLKMLGDHEVKAVSRAREAIEVLLSGERFDVILVDLMMPVMTGMDLHEELSRAVPDQAARMAFITGGAFTVRARAFLERVPNPRVEKPIDAGELATLIEEMRRRTEGM